ncbi:MAG: right-handed parallel beta-helix repeat-containing protein [Pseudomonadota bacterium]
MRHPTLSAALLVLLGACHPTGISPKDGDTGLDDTQPGPDDTDQPLTDQDGDGYTSDEDCDDTDPDVHPGAPETEDGVDDDCDGYVDETEICDDDIAPYASIQDAIDDADDDDVLQVCPGTYRENLAVYAKRLTLVSMEGPEVTIVDGGGATTLAVTQVGGAGLSVQGFTLQGGVAEQYGGGIACSQSTLGLQDDIVTGNAAPNGAGMVASACVLSLMSNVFSGNVATTTGGGAYLSGCEGQVVGNTFSGNSANLGGGLAVQGDDLTVAENEFRANEALFNGAETAFGAGMYLAGSSPVSENEFIENVSEDDGGGIYVYLGYGDFNGNLLQGNVCGNDGAGAYFSQTHAHIYDNSFIENVSYDDAGGLRLYISYATVEDNDLIGNTANDDGGGVKASHSHSNTIRRLYLEGNVAGDAGGGLEMDNETSPVTDCTFVENEARRGAGLHNWRNDHMPNTFSNLVFEGNVASGCGGAISLDNEVNRVTIRNSTFTGNSADDGAVVCSDEFWWDADDDGEAESMAASNIYLANLVAWDNEASDDGAFSFRQATVTMANVSVWGQVGVGSAGIAAKEDSTVTVVNTIIAGSEGAPALYQREGATLTFTYGDLYDNAAGNVLEMDDPTGTHGNIAEDPRFTDASGGDLTLSAGSPCIDAGDPARAYYDADGSHNDMGAFGGPYSESW